MEKQTQPCSMRQVLEEMEISLKGKPLIRLLEDTEGDQEKPRIPEVGADAFFSGVRRAAGRIRREGLAGGHIGIMGKNSCEWLVCLCAVFHTGSTAVLLDAALSPEALTSLAEKVDLDGLLYDGEVSRTVAEAKFSLPVKCIRFGKQVYTETDPAPEETAGETADDESALRNPDSPACIFFTSGTTGGSKAVMMSEKALAAGICHHIFSRKFDAILAVLPFHHISGFTAALNAFYLGARVCIAGDQSRFFEYLEYLKPDYISVVPSILRMLVKRLKKGGRYGSLLGWNVRMISCGGAAFCPEVLDLLHECGITVFQGYGASEAGAIGFLWEMTGERPDTIGKPPAQLEAKIVDGELWIRSDAVMSGYYGDPEATREVLRDGWYITGDLCRQDEEGYYYITGRKKNLIILSNGENVSPEEIEQRMYEYGQIREILVGEEEDRIAAAILPEYPPESTEAEREALRTHIRESVSDYNDSVPLYRQIRRIRFLDAPAAKTSGGKLIRHTGQKGGNDCE